MKLTVLQDERFTCHSCTKCCRNWHVELVDGEVEHIQNLRWSSNDPLDGAEVILRHAGKRFVAHHADGACVFLNVSNGLCRIHEQFGEMSKPLGCRLFPFQIRSTFAGEATVMGRYDCPSVRRNEGKPHADQLADLRRISSTLQLAEPFAETICCGLSRDQVSAVCEFAATMVGGFERDAQRAVFLFSLANLLEMTAREEITRESLASILPGLRRLAIDATSVPAKRPGASLRSTFRSLLGQYLRRDEEVLDRRAGRISRAIAMTKLVLGFGSFHALGLSHPAGSVGASKLFQPTLEPSDGDTFALFWRMIRNKLDTFQFIGSSNGGRNLFAGLRSLALLYPLTFAVAKYAAVNRGAGRIEACDVDLAVATIEHSFGRSPALNQAHTRSLENRLLRVGTFSQLVHSV